MDNSALTQTQTALASHAVRLARAFSLIALDLSNPWDESTDRFFPFHVSVADDLTLDAESLRVPLSVGPRFHLDVFEPNLIEVANNWGGDDAVGYRLLDAVMRASLTDLKLVFARADNVVRARTWVLGGCLAKSSLACGPRAPKLDGRLVCWPQSSPER